MGADRRLTAFSFRRQLLDGVAPSALAAIEAVGGVYSAMPTGPLSIRARCRSVAPGAVRALERERQAVRIRAMRTSAFLVARSQAACIAAATSVPGTRLAWLRRAAGVSDDALPGVRAAVMSAATDPGTPAELRDRLAVNGHDLPSWADGARLRAVLSLLAASGDLVTVGGASLSSNALRYVDRHAWLGEGSASDAAAASVCGAGAPTTDEARAWLAGTYLRAFGPARVEDLAWWAGWTRRVAADSLAAHAVVDVGDGLLLLAADLPAFESVTALPPTLTLVPKWDAWTMGYPVDGRSRFLDHDVHDRVFDGDGNGLAMVLRGGRAVGAWTHRGARGQLDVDLDLFEPLRRRERDTIGTELAAIASFLGYRGLLTRDVASVIPDRRRQRRPLGESRTSSRP